MEVSKSEIHILNMRRAEEINEFEKMLKITQSPNEKQDWYCLEMDWYLQWKAFVTNDQTEKTISKSKVRNSENKEIGI